MSSNAIAKIFIAGSRPFVEKELARHIEKMEDPEERLFYGDEFIADDFFPYINSPALFNPEKYIILKRADQLSNLDEVITACKNVSECALFFVAEKLPAKAAPASDEEGGKKGKKADIKQLLEDAGFSVMQEMKISKASARDEVLDGFHAHGFPISSEDAEEILELCGRNVGVALSEAEKLSLFYHYKKPRDTRDLIHYIAGVQTDVYFELTDAFGMRERDKVLNYYRDFAINRETQNASFYGVSKRVIEIRQCLVSPDLLKGHPFVVDKVKRMAKKWSVADANRMLAALLEEDVKLKTGGSDLVTSFITLTKYL